MDVINGLQQSPRPQSVVGKKTEYVLLKKHPEILVPLGNQGKSQEIPKIMPDNIYKFHTRLFKVGQF